MRGEGWGFGMMLEELRGLQESETVEFKQVWEDSSCLRALAALCNTRGGTLAVGWTDEGRPAGWSVSGSEQTRLTNKIQQILRIQPIQVTVLEVADQVQIMLVRVAQAPFPVPYEGRYYRRVGNSSREVLSEEMASFLLQRLGTTWDAIVVQQDIANVDEGTVRRFRQLASQRLPAIEAEEELSSILSKLNLLRDGSPTYAALLLFGKNPQYFFPQAVVRIGRFKDAVSILDDKVISGNLFQQLDEIMLHLRGYLQVRYEVPSGGNGTVENLQRRDIWEYPLDGVREVVLNALIHRDYMSQENIQIRVFDHHVLISNPGSLLGGLTVDILKQDIHPSITRNPLIAGVAYYASLIERWGSGITRLRKSLEKQGMPDAEIVIQDQRFVIEIRKKATLDRLKEVRFRGTVQIAWEKAMAAGSITNQEVREAAGVSDESARRALKKLVDLGLLHIERQGKQTKYIINKP